jgi:cell division protein FtsB
MHVYLILRVFPFDQKQKQTFSFIILTVVSLSTLFIFCIDSQLQTAALKKELATEKEEKVKLAAEIKDLHSQMQKMKIERSRLVASVSEKVGEI